MSIVELKELCAQKQLKEFGNKLDLISRLMKTEKISSKQQWKPPSRQQQQEQRQRQVGDKMGRNPRHNADGKNIWRRDPNVLSHSNTGSNTKNKKAPSFFEAVDERMRLQKEEEQTRRKSQHIMNSSDRRSIPLLPPLETGNDYLSSLTKDISTKFEANSGATISSSSSSDRKSIFDMFPILDSVSQSKNDDFPTNHVLSYDHHQYMDYKKAVLDVLQSKKFMSKKSPEVLEAIQNYVLLDHQLELIETGDIRKGSSDPVEALDGITQFLQNNGTKALNSDGGLRTALMNQSSKFTARMKFTPEMFTATGQAFMVLADRCAKTADASPLFVAWQKVKESGITLRESTLSTWLYVAGNSVSFFSTSDSYNGSSSSGSIFGNVFNDTSISSNRNSSLSSLLGDLPPLQPLISSQQHHPNEKPTAPEHHIDIPGEVATFHDLLYEPTEKSISLRVKGLVRRGEVAEAEALLLSMSKPSLEMLRLRTYLPVLQGYCAKGDCEAAVRLLRRMRKEEAVFLEPENYVLIISTLAENGWFRDDAPPLEMSLDDDFEDGMAPVFSGPKLFDHFARQMAQDALEITSSSARRLHNSFLTGMLPKDFASSSPLSSSIAFVNMNNIANNSTKEGKQKPLLLPPLTSLQPNNDRAKDNQLILSRVTIDNKTALCPRSNTALHLIVLDSNQRQQLHQDLVRLAGIQYMEWGSSSKASPKTDEKKSSGITSPNTRHENKRDKKQQPKLSADEKNNRDSKRAEYELSTFADWLNVRKGEPFTAIVDGANVAYSGQNFEQGRFNYHQIKFLTDALISMGENPLVIVPYKYTMKTFHTNNGAQKRRQILNDVEQDILFDFRDDGRLYRVPARCLDDYYWMLASVSDQLKPTGGKGVDMLHVSPNIEGNETDKISNNINTERFPGTRPMLITNDQMRDHKLELLDTRLFRRWTSCHIVNYNFTAFVGNECVDNEIGLSTPDFFSREIQGNPSGDGTAWHFPVSDW
eukprot:CAMPEP_0194385956 /NCGR_PEP_ID=MMETSP0174-20130528/83507_1 /TAXON_ID=216777 /ORGANISM="Proboscia alata, Strain PI-D3" /LENGTH=986 /DNA_ID=CAMNT_0039174605 /DNA_START=542 /DNA_END=3499 /DNA_ORIENTATION=-